MTVHTPRILTDAETSLIEAFAAADLPGSDAVATARNAAIDALETLGLPTRRIEAFHYTDLRALLGTGRTVSQRPSAQAALERTDSYQRLVNAIRLPIMDGHYFADIADDLPDGISVMPSFAAGGFGKCENTAANAVEVINTAFVTDGVSIDVEAGTQIVTPIGLANTFAGATGGMAVTRNTMKVGEGAEIGVIDRYVGPDETDYLSSNIMDLELCDGANVSYVLSIEDGDAAQRLARLNVRLGKETKLNLFILNVGGRLVRQEINFDVWGEGCSLNISGVNLIGGDAHIDVTSQITHHVAGTNATETFRNVATGRGKGVFQGQINVRQAAQLTDARMACNTLLLSDDCDFSAKPELEIFADDVQCAHGATVTDLEESYMFYLMARGISETRARRLLIKGFVAEIVEELEDEVLVEALEDRIEAWMEKHV